MESFLMKIEFVVLADAAQVAGGKLFILGGGWSLFRAMHFPSPVQLAVAASISFTASEIGLKFPLQIIVADDAGVPIVPPMKGEVQTGQAAADTPRGATHRVPVAANMGITLPRAGKYAITVTIGSSKVAVSFDAIFVGQRVEFSSEAGSAPEQGN